MSKADEMFEELEEAIKELADKKQGLERHINNYEKDNCNTAVYTILVQEKNAIETVLNYINNSTPNTKLDNLIAEMRKDGSNYWADRIKEIKGKV